MEDILDQNRGSYVPPPLLKQDQEETSRLIHSMETYGKESNDKNKMLKSRSSSPFEDIQG